MWPGNPDELSGVLCHRHGAQVRAAEIGDRVASVLDLTLEEPLKLWQRGTAQGDDSCADGTPLRPPQTVCVMPGRVPLHARCPRALSGRRERRAAAAAVVLAALLPPWGTVLGHGTRSDRTNNISSM